MGRLWGDMSRYELDVRLVREMGRYGEIWGDTVQEMYQEIWRDMARYGEMWEICVAVGGELRRVVEGRGRRDGTLDNLRGEIWGDLGRSGEIWEPSTATESIPPTSLSKTANAAERG